MLLSAYASTLQCYIGRDAYCKFYWKQLPQISKILDMAMGTDVCEMYRPCRNGWRENG